MDSREELVAAADSLGLPAVLKTRRLGYDGKGQAVLRTRQDVKSAWEQLGSAPLILESFVPFDRELSSIAVRSRDGHAAFYPLVQNEHREGILRISRAPVPGLDARIQALAESHSRAVLESLAYVGVLAIEWFQVGDRLLLRVAPLKPAGNVGPSGHRDVEAVVGHARDRPSSARCGCGPV